MKWQECEDERVRAGWETQSLSIIAKALGRTRSAVVSRAGRLGLPPKPQPLTMLERPVATGRQRGHTFLPPPPAALLAQVAGEPLPTAAVKSLYALAPFDCRWPIGDSRDPGFGFCGAAALRPYGYCPQHHAVSIGRPR